MPWVEVLPLIPPLVPPDDFMLAPVVVVECALGCLCMCIFASAASGEPIRPVTARAAIASLVFIMKRSPLLDDTGEKLFVQRTVPAAEWTLTDGPGALGGRAPGPPFHTECSRRDRGESAPKARARLPAGLIVPLKRGGASNCREVLTKR